MTSRKESALVFFILFSCFILVCQADGESVVKTDTVTVAHGTQHNQELNGTKPEIKRVTLRQVIALENKTQPVITVAQPVQSKITPMPSKPQLINIDHSSVQGKAKQTPTIAHFDEPTIALSEKLPNVTELKVTTTTTSPSINKSEFLSKPIDHPTTPNPELAHQTLMQAEIEEQRHEEQVEQQNSALKPWIVEQMKRFSEQNEAIITESFEFMLDPQASFEFRWNPPKTKQLRLSVMVFQVVGGGGIMLMRDNDYTEYINIHVRDEGQSYMNAVGEVYIARIFSINFDTDYKYFKFVSSNPGSVLVMVDLERLDEVVPVEGVARDQHFLLAESKLQRIQLEVASGEKIQEHTYKYEWGYLQNQYAHESKLLGLTGFELIIIMSCAVMQLFFIKSLLDNRAVV